MPTTSTVCAEAVALLSGEPGCLTAFWASALELPSPEKPGTKIALASHLGPLTCDLTAQQMPLGRDLDQAIAFLCPRPFEMEYSLPEGLTLHSATKRALEAAAPFLDFVNPVLLDELQIFTDGSFRQGISAWSVVVVGSVAQRVRWMR